MKIGIVTQPLLNNYGGILQNYAMQQVLKKMGHEPVTIDYIAHYNLKVFIAYTLKTILLLFSNKSKRNFNSYYRKRKSYMNSFVLDNISITEPYKRYKKSIIEDNKFEAIVVGSDQVWRKEYNNDLYAMFLSFAHQRCIKVAYAASFGIDHWNYNKKQTKKCSILAKQFKGISVREESGIDLCKKNLEVDAINVLDPTLLLVKEDYEKLCYDIDYNNTPTLYAYILDLNDEKREFIKKIAVEKNLIIKIVQADNNAKFTIPQWIAMFRDAKFVVTDSFHGTLFSIIFRKDFISIGNKGRGLSRFISILSKLGLNDRLVVDCRNHNKIEPIDWSKVENELNNNIRKSESFILESLSK